MTHKDLLSSAEPAGRSAAPKDSARTPVRPGRTLGFALSAAGATIVMSLLLSGAVSSRISSLGGNTPSRSGASTTLFYHPTHEQTFRGNPDGQVYLDAKANGHPLRFRVDGTVPNVLLSPDDARAAGLVSGAMNYSGSTTTTIGVVRTAPATIPYMQFGTLTLFNVEAVIADAPIPESILGAGFLKRFPSFELRQGDLVLRW